MTLNHLPRNDLRRIVAGGEAPNRQGHNRYIGAPEFLHHKKFA